MRRQERKNAVRLQKMTRHRLRIQQFALTIRSTLHTRIIANNQRKQADRRAGLFRAFLGRDGGRLCACLGGRLQRLGDDLCDVGHRLDLQRLEHIGRDIVQIGLVSLRDENR